MSRERSRKGRIGAGVADLGVAAAAGLLVDRRLGEPPVRLHPVVWFGRAMSAVEQRIYADRRSHGVAYCAAGVTLGAAAGLLLQRLLGRRGATVAATALAVGGRMLDEEARGIAARLEQGDLVGARQALRSLVGRSTETLSEAEVVRAVIESVAENTVDAVTAALWCAAVGGAPAVAAYRAINTMDAMVGHRNPRYQHFGWAAARVDDAVNLIPARLTAALLMAPWLRGRTATDADRSIPPTRRVLLRQLRAQAAHHPSPNGGLVEAAFAHRLRVVLGGINHYGDSTEDRGRLGWGAAPTRSDIHRAVALRRQVSAVTAVLITLLPLLFRSTSRCYRRRAGR